jgi:hypothetical protein
LVVDIPAQVRIPARKSDRILADPPPALRVVPAGVGLVVSGGGIPLIAGVAEAGDVFQPVQRLAEAVVLVVGRERAVLPHQVADAPLVVGQHPVGAVDVVDVRDG